MCLKPYHDVFRIRERLPDEFFVYKVVEQRHNDDGFFSPLQYGHYFLNQETVAQGDGYQHNPGYIEGGSIHTLLRLEDAKKYRANLRVGSYLETWKKLVIIKCFVKLEDFVAIGETVLDYISYQNSLCFKKVTPVEIINEQVSEL
jgi:hypothetical protein